VSVAFADPSVALAVLFAVEFEEVASVPDVALEEVVSESVSVLLVASVTVVLLTAG